MEALQYVSYEKDFTSTEYIEYIHSSNNTKHIVLAKKSSVNNERTWKQKSFEVKNDFYDISMFIDSVNNKCEDCYITMNSFKYGKRDIKAVKEYNSFYIDLDFYKLGLSKEQVLFLLEEDYINKIVPNPNFIIDSGRGMYLIWKISPLEKNRDTSTLWRRVQRILLNKLKEFNSDRQAIDEARVLRVPGTINTKCNKMVEIVSFYNYTYDIEDFKLFYEDELKADEKNSNSKNKKNKKQRSSEIRINKIINTKMKKVGKISYIERTRSLYLSRIDDLEKLVELREGRLYKCRELVLFLYRYYLTMFTQDINESYLKTLELNSKFEYPFSEYRVKVDTESVAKVMKSRMGKHNYATEYRYTNERLIELLSITEDEQKHMSTIISVKEKNRRNNEACKKRQKESRRNSNGLTSKEQKKQELVNKIHELKIEGYKQIEIAEKLKVNKATVSKYLKLPYIELKPIEKPIQMTFSDTYFNIENIKTSKINEDTYYREYKESLYISQKLPKTFGLRLREEDRDTG